MAGVPLFLLLREVGSDPHQVYSTGEGVTASCPILV